MCSLIFRGYLSGHKGPITAIVSPRGPIDDTVYSASQDKTVIIWDIMREEESNYGVPRHILADHADVVQSIAIAPVCENLVSASWDKTLRLWDTDNGETLNVLHGHSDKVLYATFTNDGRRVVSSSEDKSFKLWGLGGTCQGDFVPFTEQPNNEKKLTCFSFIPDDSFVYAIGEKVYLAEWFGKISSKKSYLLVTHKDVINAIATSHEGTILAASCVGSGELLLYNLDESTPIDSIHTGGKEIFALSFSPDNHWLAVATSTSIEIWDIDGKVKLTVVDTPSACTSIGWSGNGYSIYSGHSDNSIHAWEVDRP